MKQDRAHMGFVQRVFRKRSVSHLTHYKKASDCRALAGRKSHHTTGNVAKVATTKQVLVCGGHFHKHVAYALLIATYTWISQTPNSVQLGLSS